MSLTLNDIGPFVTRVEPPPINETEPEVLLGVIVTELPKYNPEPVFIFSKDGHLQYKNKNCPESLISQITPLVPTLEDNSKNYTAQVDGKTYFINFEFSNSLNLIFGYCFDATEIIKLQEEIISTQKEVVYRMGEIGESRSKETGNHVKRVAEYSYLLAKLYGIEEDEAQTLKIASPMHDIGKVGISDNILHKPAKLDNKEWEIMKTHASLGHDLLKHSDRPIMRTAAIVAKEHHEKWDGSGYPNGLKEEEIHIFGRITAIADVFDALGSIRSYKEAWELKDILEYIQNQKGKHFDPKLVDLFTHNLDKFLYIKEKFKD
jgi:response regulator RpfG family c-di-GMP phosphodiesterase